MNAVAIQLTERNLEPIPHPPRLPLIGNLHQVARGPTVIDAFTRLFRAHGRIIELSMPDGLIVLVGDAELAAELCDEGRFEKGMARHLVMLQPAAGDGLFTVESDAPNWGKAHRILMPAFSKASIERYVPRMVEQTNALLDRWAGQPDEWIPVSDDMTRVTLDIISKCGFDFDLGMTASTGSHPFVQAMVDVLLQVQIDINRPPLVTRLDRTGRRRRDDGIAQMRQTVDEIIQQRRRDGVGGDDLLARMMTARDPRTGEMLDDANIRNQVLTFLIAGHETTSGLLSFALAALLRHPDVMLRAMAEVDAVLGPDPHATPTAADLSRLTYLRQVIDETMRLWPTAPVFARTPRHDTVIGGRYAVPAGAMLMCITPEIHRDPAAWGADAERFDPDRFGPSAKPIPRAAFRPFGAGPRACIGRQFALNEALVVLSMILKRFSPSGEPGYQMKLHQTLTIKPEGLRMRLRARRPSWPVSRPTAPPTAVRPVPQPARRGPGPIAANQPIAVYYGSNLGSTEALARGLAGQADRLGHPTRCAPLDDAVDALDPSQIALIVCATYNGQPPDNAQAFVQWLEGLAPGALSGVRYGLLGCGHRDWATTFLRVPRRIDAALQAAGAVRVAPFGEADGAGDSESDTRRWTSALWSALAEAGLSDGVGHSGAPGEVELRWLGRVQRPPLASHYEAVPMTIAVNRELQRRAPDGTHRSTRHIELVPPAGVSWTPGDHLGVMPRNRPDQVQRACGAFGIDADALLELADAQRRWPHLPTEGPLTAGELLASTVDLQSVARRVEVEAMVEHTRCPVSRSRLASLLADDAAWRAEVLEPSRSALDLLVETPACRLPFAAWLAIAPRLEPRLYSIASDGASPHIALSVAVVEGPARHGDGIYRGVCSAGLRDRQPGEVVLAFVRSPAAPFRLPAEPETPMIMIGAGTGIAPFRGFMEARDRLAAQGARLGPARLYFGCRHPETDWLYRADFEAWSAAGLVDVRPAFSRPSGGGGQYVQARVEADAREIGALIERGARIYVCGDGRAMEPGVRAALVAGRQAFTGCTAEDAQAWLDALIAQGRYVTDVWAG